MKRLLKKVAFLLLRDKADVRKAAALLGLMTLAAAMEALGVGMIMPFIALIQNPALVDDYARLRQLREAVGASSNVTIVYLCGLALVLLFVVKNGYLALVQWAQFRFLFGWQAALSRGLVQRFLNADYTFHLRRNSADLIQAVAHHVAQLINHVALNLFVITVETLTVVVIVILLVVIEPIAVPVVGGTLAAVAFAFYRVVNRKSLELGKEEAVVLREALKWMQQGLGGIKETLVLGRERFFVEGFDRQNIAYNRSQSFHRMVQLLPRYVLETLGIIGLVAVGVSMLARHNDASRIVPTLGVIAVAAIRLLPAVARILGSLTDLRHHTPSAELLKEALEAPGARAPRPPASTVPPLEFKKELRFVDVSYTYPGADRPSLSGVSFVVRRGESVAFVGLSGAGKTTMVDLLIGLLTPTSGVIEVDGQRLEGTLLQRWQRGLGYIPQNVYLCDDSVLRNVAFGLEDAEIDRERARKALEAARLLEHIESLPKGLDTFVGERGVRISGGQRQRIGIARALYLQPEVLVLDEATSSLDSQTEREIVENLEQIRQDRTAFIVAHRLSTVRRCDRIVFLGPGRVDRIGTWDELCNESDAFRNLVKLGSTEEVANRMSP